MEIFFSILGVLALIALIWAFSEGVNNLTIEKIVPLMEFPLQEKDLGKLGEVPGPPQNCLESEGLTILRWNRGNGTERIAIHAKKHAGTIGITYRNGELQDWQHNGAALHPLTESQKGEVSRLLSFIHASLEQTRVFTV